MKTYRQGVVAIILGPDEKVLVGERSDTSGHWQLPQGGLDAGETDLQALSREVFEEVGVKNLKVLKQTSDYIKTDWPPEILNKKKRHNGQEHIYFVLQGNNIDPSKLAPTEEFANFKWISLESLLKEVVSWRRSSYEAAFRQLNLLK